jgi:aspartyl-tRNA(Asn)/glutamyl-tRNA(Gln) amidotransferase subunit B
LEEDTAKSFHEGNKTLIDFNKSGLSLMEIVTTPCFNEVADAVDFCKKIQDITRVINVSDADMEKGNMRLEVNVSLRTPEMEKRNEIPKYKVEVKNINSFRFMEKAVMSEIKRQAELLSEGKTPMQENRGWDEKRQSTVSQRDKEEAHDYRYFPEPDVPPMVFNQEYFDDLKRKLPELPHQLRKRLIEIYGLNVASADFFSTGSGIELSKKFEEVTKQRNDPKKVANLLINKPRFREMLVEQIVALLGDDVDNTIPHTADLHTIIKRVLEENQSAVQNYILGKQNVLQFLTGLVIKETKGKFNPADVIKVIKRNLNGKT